MGREYFTINFKPDVKAFVANNLANSGSFVPTGKDEDTPNKISDAGPIYVAGDNVGLDYYGPVMGSFYSDLTPYLIAGLSGGGGTDLFQTNPQTNQQLFQNLANNITSYPYLQSGSYLNYLTNLLFYFPTWNHEIKTAALQTLYGNNEENIYLSTLVPTTCKIEGVIYENKAYNKEIHPNIINIPLDPTDPTSVNNLPTNRAFTLNAYIDNSYNGETGEFVNLLPPTSDPELTGSCFNSIPSFTYFNFNTNLSTRLFFAGTETVLLPSQGTTYNLQRIIPSPDSVLNSPAYDFKVGDSVTITIEFNNGSSYIINDGEVLEYNSINNNLTIHLPPNPTITSTGGPPQLITTSNNALSNFRIVNNTTQAEIPNGPTLRNVVQFKTSQTLIPKLKLDGDDTTYSITTGNRIGGLDNGLYFESTPNQIEFKVLNDMSDNFDYGEDFASFGNFLGGTFAPYSDFGANRNFGLSFEQPLAEEEGQVPGGGDVTLNYPDFSANSEDYAKATQMFALGGAFTPGKNTVIKGVYTIY